MKDIYDTVKETEFLKTLSTALDAVGLSETLSGPGPFTFFAPVEDYFLKLSVEDRKNFLQNKWKLERLLSSQVMADRVSIIDIENMGLAKMINEKEFKIFVKNDGILIDEAKIMQSDIQCTNGMIHAVDGFFEKDEK
jgi:uncharacterized surface protein with fasciclin (FAS1) repeats